MYSAATLIPKAGSAARCLAGELTHVAWQEQLLTATVMDLVGSGSGEVMSATKVKGPLL